MRYAIAALAVAVVALSACEPTEGATGEVAKTMCEEFVKDRLKAPTTAEFYDATATKGVSGWTVDGNVDSENSFGGMVKNRYRCKVTNTHGDTWHLNSLTGLVN